MTARDGRLRLLLAACALMAPGAASAEQQQRPWPWVDLPMRFEGALLAEPPEVRFDPAAYNGKCGHEFRVDGVRAAKGVVELSITLVEAESVAASSSAPDACACKTFRPSLTLTHVKRANGKTPVGTRMWERWPKLGERKTYRLAQTIRAKDGRETYWLRAACGG